MSRRSGFTLIELLVVVLIIGVLASIAVPQYIRVVEKGRVSEGITYAQSIRGAEERTLLKTGSYVTSTGIDTVPPALKGFTASAITPNAGTSWSLVLTRCAAVPAYGQYSVTYNSVLSPPLSCSNASCQTDLMP